MSQTTLKILYGVQATGNGHIARARVLAPALREAGAEVTYLFSGRPREQLFDMEQFGEFQVREGFTFSIEKGKVKHLKTVFNANAPAFFNDLHALDLAPYDLVLSDYEPVTAWASRLSHKPCIGIGNQYAYKHDIPVAGANKVTEFFMNKIAPTKLSLGLHWHHFNQPILPPMIDVQPVDTVEPGKILVYMGFETIEDIRKMVAPFTDHRFVIYSPLNKEVVDDGNILLRPPSRAEFLADFRTCEGVIANAGFETPSEALQLGKKVLVKPLSGQMEQLSNAKALTQLNLGGAMKNLNSAAVEAWLKKDDYNRVTFPNVAPMIAEWVMARDFSNPKPLIEKAWAETKFVP